jgi:hypothetical protein
MPATATFEPIPGGFVEALRPAWVAAMYDIGRQEVISIMVDLSVPVGRDGQGNVVERSQPGESPRMETGGLRKSVEYEVVNEPGGLPVLRLTVGDPSGGGGAPHADYLQDVLNRPILDRARARVVGYAAEVIAAHLNAANQ